MKVIYSQAAIGTIFLAAFVVAQDYTVEFNRICPTPSQGEVQIESGFFVTYHCDTWPSRNSYKATLQAATPEECTKSCAKAPDCEASLWSTGKTSGCFSFGIDTLVSKPGYLYTTYRQDCDIQKKSVIDTLNQQVADLQDLLKKEIDNHNICKADKQQCGNDLKTCEDSLKKCENDFKKCRDDLKTCTNDRKKYKDDLKTCTDDLKKCRAAPAPVPKPATIPVQPPQPPSSCNAVQNGQIYTFGGVKYKASTGIRQPPHFVIDFNHIIRNYQESLPNCMRNCASNSQCRVFHYNNAQRWCDHYKADRGTNADGNFCHFSKV